MLASTPSFQPHPGAFGASGKAALVGVGMLALAGCRGEVEKTIAFSAVEHQPYAANGTATIDGEGFLRRPNGLLARCSGAYVYLVPATPYFREWVEINRKGGAVANAKELAGAHQSAIRKVQCDMQGRFLFTQLPAGKWYAVTRVSYDGAEWNAAQTLTAEIETKAGEVVKAILANPNGT